MSVSMSSWITVSRNCVQVIDLCFRVSEGRLSWARIDIVPGLENMGETKFLVGNESKAGRQRTRTHNRLL